MVNQSPKIEKIIHDDVDVDDKFYFCIELCQLYDFIDDIVYI
jgi:hypothetical protein